jgi:hypothetical protein
MRTNLLASFTRTHFLRDLQIAIHWSLLICALLASGLPADEMTPTFLVANSRIDVHLEKGPLQISNQDLLQWVHWASDSVTTFYGRYPVPTVLLRIIPSQGEGVRGGRTLQGLRPTVTGRVATDKSRCGSCAGEKFSANLTTTGPVPNFLRNSKSVWSGVSVMELTNTKRASAGINAQDMT